MADKGFDSPHSSLCHTSPSAPSLYFPHFFPHPPLPPLRLLSPPFASLSLTQLHLFPSLPLFPHFFFSFALPSIFSLIRFLVSPHPCLPSLPLCFLSSHIRSLPSPPCSLLILFLPWHTFLFFPFPHSFLSVSCPLSSSVLPSSSS